MSDKADEQFGEKEIQRRINAAVRRALITPPQPRESAKKKSADGDKPRRRRSPETLPAPRHR